MAGAYVSSRFGRELLICLNRCKLATILPPNTIALGPLFFLHRSFECFYSLFECCLPYRLHSANPYSLLSSIDTHSTGTDDLVQAERG